MRCSLALTAWDAGHPQTGSCGPSGVLLHVAMGVFPTVWNRAAALQLSTD